MINKAALEMFGRHEDAGHLTNSVLCSFEFVLHITAALDGYFKKQPQQNLMR